jgi:hypothetical protein
MENIQMNEHFGCAASSPRGAARAPQGTAKR